MKSMKAVLIKMRDELIRDIMRKVKETSQNIKEDIGDDLDSSFQERTREFELLLTKSKKDRLRLIEESLEKIEDGEYGKCEECGGKIPKGRLKVMPFAKYCVDCKELIEREERGQVEDHLEPIKKVPLISYEDDD